MNELKHKCCMVSEESERLLFSYGTIVNLDCFIMHGSDSNQGTDYIAILGGGGSCSKIFKKSKRTNRKRHRFYIIL